MQRQTSEKSSMFSSGIVKLSQMPEKMKTIPVLIVRSAPSYYTANHTTHYVICPFADWSWKSGNGNHQVTNRLILWYREKELYGSGSKDHHALSRQ
jgi:hypothetical protein